MRSVKQALLIIREIARSIAAVPALSPGMHRAVMALVLTTVFMAPDLTLLSFNESTLAQYAHGSTDGIVTGDDPQLENRTFDHFGTGRPDHWVRHIGNSLFVHRQSVPDGPINYREVQAIDNGAIVEIVTEVLTDEGVWLMAERRAAHGEVFESTSVRWHRDQSFRSVSSVTE